ncbi:probable palmitoyltransferase ZDHHC24 [Drosophila yakuba]|uniref:Palmitoyltransferase n=1 Tax=Drosophila yakuba TaxID=7245 RepID=B4PTG6_DROYA|nr:probable palmitoyltransferase ZDHHC24 [Drosophila yakuba]EDW98706.1 uncharacterized protein Dyak_GE10666 [Drosophila yakuba]
MCYVNRFCQYIANRCPRRFVQIVHPLSAFAVLSCIAFFFCLQMFYIAPKVFNDLGYKLYWIFFTFITHNILGNMLACYMTSSSVNTLSKDSQSPAPEEEHLWHKCEVCKKLSPPRSWHCVLCNTCTLRRDHHCIFIGNCIGHNNQRYFFWFTFYSTLGLLISFATLCMYVLQNGGHFKKLSFMIVDLISQIFSQPHSGNNFETLVLLLNISASYMPGFMLAYQMQILRQNSSYYKIFDCTYDLGFRKNCQSIMGQRGLWTFVSPLLKSPLPHDGARWQTKKSQ